MASFGADPSRRYFWSPTLYRSYPAGSTGLLDLDWIESPHCHVFNLNVPGYSEDEIKIQVEEGKVLVIKTECKEENQGKEKNIVWHLAERGNFWGEIELPEDAKVDFFFAGLEDGVLTVAVPKDASRKPSKIEDVVHIGSKL